MNEQKNHSVFEFAFEDAPELMVEKYYLTRMNGTATTMKAPLPPGRLGSRAIKWRCIMWAPKSCRC